MTESQTSVIFRVWKGSGDVIALFPYLAADFTGGCGSYMHIGQHGAADYAHVIAATRPATLDEYRPLLQELTSIGYSLNVLRKRR